MSRPTADLIASARAYSPFSGDGAFIHALADRLAELDAALQRAFDEANAHVARFDADKEQLTVLLGARCDQLDKIDALRPIDPETGEPMPFERMAAIVNAVFGGWGNATPQEKALIDCLRSVKP